MSQKNVSRESVINQSIDCTCTAISYIVSHSSNEDFRKAVMTSLQVNDTIQLKSKLHSKLTDISRRRHGGLSQWQVADGKIMKTGTFEANSFTDKNNKDDWSKIETLLHTDDISASGSGKHNEHLTFVRNEVLSSIKDTDLPRITNENKPVSEDVQTSAKQDMRDFTSTNYDIMKTPDLSQIIEGVKNVSPFCLLAVESPTVNNLHERVTTCSSSEVNYINAVQDFPHSTHSDSANLHKGCRMNQCYPSEVHVPKGNESVDELNGSQAGTCNELSDNYIQCITCEGDNSLDTGSSNDLCNVFKAEKLTQNEKSFGDNSSSSSPKLCSKRLRAEEKNIAEIESTVTQKNIEKEVLADKNKPENTEEWFDNVLLEIEDWLN